MKEMKRAESWSQVLEPNVGATMLKDGISQTKQSATLPPPRSLRALREKIHPHVMKRPGAGATRPLDLD